MIVFHGDGDELAVALEDVRPGSVTGRLVKRVRNLAEPPVDLTLFVGLTQREKFEWVLQKCTEVGVNHIVPLLSSRSLVQKGNDFSAKQARWERILQEAAEQSGRGRIPRLRLPLAFNAAVAEIDHFDLGLFAWEEKTGTGLRSVLAGSGLAKRVGLMIGPEGGFSVEEAAGAEGAGWKLVGLGAGL